MINIISLLAGYLIGSINPAILISKLFFKTDIRQHGSGNAGATNVLRTLGKGAAIAVTLVDVLKGIIAIGIISLVFGNVSEYIYLAGLGAILGHNFPLYFNFKGGKGILTSFGILLVLDWRVALIAFIVGIALIAVTRYVSLGSVMAAVSVIVTSFIFAPDTLQIVILCIMGALAIFMHRSNIKRLLKGNERKLGEKK